MVCRLLPISVQAQEIQWLDINLINCLVSGGYETEAFKGFDMTNALLLFTAEEIASLVAKLSCEN